MREKDKAVRHISFLNTILLQCFLSQWYHYPVLESRNLTILFHISLPLIIYLIVVQIMSIFSQTPANLRSQTFLKPIHIYPALLVGTNTLIPTTIVSHQIFTLIASSLWSSHPARPFPDYLHFKTRVICMLKCKFNHIFCVFCPISHPILLGEIPKHSTRHGLVPPQIPPRAPLLIYILDTPLSSNF